VRYADRFEHRDGVGWQVFHQQAAFEWMRRESEDVYPPIDT
jgi:hypothetical protein